MFGTSIDGQHQFMAFLPSAQPFIRHHEAQLGQNADDELTIRTQLVSIKRSDFCPSVRPSVCPPDRPSVRPSVRPSSLAMPTPRELLDELRARTAAGEAGGGPA